MKKFLLVLFVSVFSLTPTAGAQIGPSNSSGLQNQSGSVQGNNSGLQNGSSLQQNSAPLDSFNQSSSSIPIPGSATQTSPAPQATSAKNETSWVSTLLIVCLAIGGVIVIFVLWGVFDSRKNKVPPLSNTKAQPETKPQVTQKKKKKSKSTTRRKRKKAHR